MIMGDKRGTSALAPEDLRGRNASLQFDVKPAQDEGETTPPRVLGDRLPDGVLSCWIVFLTRLKMRALRHRSKPD